MRPAFRLIALILLVCLIGSGRAEAGIWDWLEELNGPGPSTSKHGPAIMANLYCSEAKSRSKPEGSSAGIKVLNRAFQIPDAPGLAHRRPGQRGVRGVLCDLRRVGCPHLSQPARGDERRLPVDWRLVRRPLRRPALTPPVQGIPGLVSTGSGMVRSQPLWRRSFWLKITR